MEAFFMPYSVYILISSSTKQFYIGQTQNLEKRLIRHNAGYVKSSKGRGPWRIYFHTEVASRKEALKLERKLKNLKSRQRIKTWVQKRS